MEEDNNQSVIAEDNSERQSDADSNPRIPNNVDLECLELRECTTELVPAHLLQLLQFYSPKDITSSEIIFLLSYISAIEIGYVTLEDYAEMGDDLVIPGYGVNYYHSKNIMKMTKKKPFYIADEHQRFFKMKLMLFTNIVPSNIDLSVMLTATVAGEWLILSISPLEKKLNLCGYSSVLVLDRYVVNVYNVRKPIQKRLRRIDELSKKIADEVFLPMRAQLNAIIEKYPDASLDRLPTEVYDHIKKYLTGTDADRLSEVVKREEFDYLT